MKVVVAQTEQLEALFDRLRTAQAELFEDRFGPFIERLRTMGGERFDIERYQEATAAFERLRGEHREMVKAVIEADCTRAERYSLIDVLGWHTDEVRTHSAFLADLLSAKSTHAQGSLFLRRFIQAVVPEPKQAPLLNADGDAFAVTIEAPAGTGAIDILVECASPASRFAIVIENKIHAGDQCCQLERYYAHVTQTLGYRDEQLLLVYLTLDGHLPSASSLRTTERVRLTEAQAFRCISYADDVSQWLRACLPEVQAPTVAEVIRQYLKTLSNLTGGGVMGLYEDKMHEFITKSDNFELAWEIFEAMPQVRERLKAEALSAIREYAKAHVGKIEDGQWVVEELGDEKVGIYKREWEKMFCINVYIGKRWYQSMGLWHNTEDERLSGKKDEITARTEAVGKANKMAHGTTDIWYAAFGKNFDSLEEMREILPGNRDAFVRRVWDDLVSWAGQFAPLVDDIVADIKAGSL